LLTDTVGFIQELPHALVAAFHATLEEAADADLVIHVVDIFDPEYLAYVKMLLL
jgi:GTP-binding protein HflX